MKRDSRHAGIRALNRYAWPLYPLYWPYQGLAEAGLRGHPFKREEVYGITLCVAGMAVQSQVLYGLYEGAPVGAFLWLYAGLTLVHLVTRVMPAIQRFLYALGRSVKRPWVRRVGWYPHALRSAFSAKTAPGARQSHLISIVLGSLWIVLNVLLLFEKPDMWTFSLPLALAAYLGFGYLVEKDQKS